MPNECRSSIKAEIFSYALEGKSGVTLKEVSAKMVPIISLLEVGTLAHGSKGLSFHVRLRSFLHHFPVIWLAMSMQCYCL